MLEQMIKDMDLIDNDYIQKKTKCDRSHINKKIRKILKKVLTPNKCSGIV